MKTKLMLHACSLCAIALFAGSGAGLAFSDANWTALGSGMNDQVYALAVSGSNVYAGGRFTMAGGHSVGYIAKWDGSSWTGLGPGMNSWVRALAVSGTNLYAGGDFTMAGNNPANRIAKWNGSSWFALGTGITGYNVSALAVSGTNLYAGGSFSTAGYSTAHNLARWNSSSWLALGSGTSGISPSPDVLSLLVSGSYLYIGGDFTTAGYTTANHVAKWDGNFWWALGSGMGSGDAISVYALAISGSTLYAGGLFTMAGSSGAADVAKWDGTSWSPLAVGMYVSSNFYPSVHALAIHGNDLYAGGGFTYAGGSVTNRTPANYIAKWDGNSWSALGSGMNMDVWALAVSGNDLYAAGKFTTAGAKAAAYVARAYLPDLPSLSVLSSDTNVTVSWPSADTADFVLEQTEGPVASWVRNLAAVSDDGTHKSVTLPPTLSVQYFRLRRP